MTRSTTTRVDHDPDHAFGYPREDEWPLESDEKTRRVLNTTDVIIFRPFPGKSLKKAKP